MEKLIKPARIAYAIMMIGLAIQQLIYAELRPVIFPRWLPAGLLLTVLAYAASIAILAAAMAIIADKNARKASVISGGVLLFILVFCQVPYELLVDYYKHLCSWTSAIKELALCGGAFVVAGSYTSAAGNQQKTSDVMALLEKLVPFGSLLFCTMLVLFGLDHFFILASVHPLYPPGYQVQFFGLIWQAWP
jgi:hypothetical protein